jgi:hypothetical protein
LIPIENVVIEFLASRRDDPGNFRSPPPMTLFNTQYSNFTPVQKLWNVFSEVFLVQIHQNFGKYISKFVFMAKKTSENAFRSLKLGAKMEIQGGKKSHGVGRENFMIQATIVNQILLYFCFFGLI